MSTNLTRPRPLGSAMYLTLTGQGFYCTLTTVQYVRQTAHICPRPGVDGDAININVL